MTLALCGDQLVVGHRLRADQPEQRVTEQVGILPVVVAEGDLIEVRRKMAGAKMVVRADDGSLEQRPHALHRVRVNVGLDPRLGMVDGLVPRVVVGDPPVQLPGVGVDRLGVIVDDLTQEGVQRAPVGSLGDAHSHASSALNRSDHEGLVALVPADGLGRSPADVGLVGLDDAHELLGRAVLHGRADAVREVPRRLVRHVEHSLELIGRDAFLGLPHEVDRQKPLPQRQVGVVEDRAGGDAELVAAGVAIELSARPDAADAIRPAARAAHAVGPAQLFEVGATLLLGVELLHKAGKVHALGEGRSL